MANYPAHEGVIRWATGELGTREVPDGSNSGSRVRFYQAHTWLGGTGWPWCAAFVDTAWDVGGGRKLPWPTAGAYDMGNRARKAGWTVSRLAQLRAGDIIVFNVGAGHVALFVSYDVRGGTVKTLDGNVSNSVAYRVRSISSIRDMIRVPEAPKPTVTPPKPPVFQVVSAADGEKVIYVSTARAISRNLVRLLTNNPAGIVIRRKKPAR